MNLYDEQTALEILDNLVQSAKMLRMSVHAKAMQALRDMLKKTIDGGDLTISVAGDNNHAEVLISQLLNMPFPEEDDVTSLREITPINGEFGAAGVRFVTVSLSEVDVESDALLRRLETAIAVVIATDATRLLTQAERKLALHFSTAVPPHPMVLIVILNSDEIARQGTFDSVRALLQEVLHPLFSTPDKAVDEQLFANRVFFVSHPDETNPNPLAELNQTLAQLLTREGRVSAAYAMSMIAVQRFVHDMNAQMETADAFVQTPSAEAADLSHISEAEIRELLADFSAATRSRLIADLHRYADELYDSWEADANTYIRLQPLKVLMALPTTLLGRDNRVYLVQESIEAYLQAKFAAWKPRAAAIIEEERQALRTRLETSAPDMQMINLSDSARVNVITIDQQQEMLTQLGRKILIGGTRTEEQVAQWVGRTVLGYLVLATTPPLVTQISVLAFIVSELLNALRQTNEFNQVMLHNLRDNIRRTIKDGMVVNAIQPQQLNYADEFIDYIRKSRDPLSQYLYSQLPDDIRREQFDTLHQDAIQVRLADVLTVLTLGELIYTSALFADVKLKPETEFALNKSERTTSETQVLNRMLLSESYPKYISPKLSDRLNTIIDFQVMSLLQPTRSASKTSHVGIPHTQDEKMLRQIGQTVNRQFDIFRSLRFDMGAE